MSNYTKNRLWAIFDKNNSLMLASSQIHDQFLVIKIGKYQISAILYNMPTKHCSFGG
jgi:hypothetical protein